MPDFETAIKPEQQLISLKKYVLIDYRRVRRTRSAARPNWSLLLSSLIGTYSPQLCDPRLNRPSVCIEF